MITKRFVFMTQDNEFKALEKLEKAFKKQFQGVESDHVVKVNITIQKVFNKEK